jgi:MerR family transcriptional regulator, light-induced transcriptional regulator
MYDPAELMTSTGAARLLGVGATAIKRWSDAGALPCVRTPGGHRRFRREDVERLHRGQSATSSDGSDVWIDTLLHSADVYATLALLFSERAEKGSWFLVADRLGTLLRHVGDGWERGAISVSEEHLLSAAFQRALSVTVESIAVPHDAPRCLLAAAEGEEHTLGLSLVELCLREAGWRALWAGAHTRSSDVVEQVQKQSVQMVALSASAFSSDRKLLRQQMKRVGSACQRHRVAFVLGGSGAWPDQPALGHRLNDCAGFARLLRRMSPSRPDPFA